MLKNVPIKKGYLLIAGTLLLAWICYQLAFKKTAEAYYIHQDLKKQVEQNSGLSYQPAYTDRKNKNLDLILSRYKMDSLALRGSVLTTLSTIAEQSDVKLAEVPVPDPAFNTAHYIIQQVDFEGDYFSLIKLLNTLQNTVNVGVIRSVVWKSVMLNPGAGVVKKLHLQVFLEVSK